MKVALLEQGHGSELSTSTDLLELYEQHYRSLVKLASMYVDTQESAEEVTQDAFTKLLAGNRQIEPGKEAPYLRSMVLNGARSRLRRRRVRRIDTLRRAAERPAVAPPAEEAGLGAVIQGEMMAALRSLPEKQAAVLILRYYMDLSEAEIAETLAIARGSVKSHAHRGLAKLARLVENPNE